MSGVVSGGVGSDPSVSDASTRSGLEVEVEVEVEPTLRVVAGNPTEDELAAVTAVLAALQAASLDERATRRVSRGTSGWVESQRALRGPLRVGPGQWGRHSA